jgi:signal peptidase I
LFKSEISSEIEAQEKRLSTRPVTPEGAQDEVLEEQKETMLEGLASICTVLVVGLFLMAFAFQNFMIPSPSMVNTLLVGDHLVVDRVTLAPATKWAPFVHYRPVKRGDIIVFYKPNPESPDLILVKRAIALPGDRLHLEHGIVYLNGVAQNEPYAIMPSDNGNPYDPTRDDFPAHGAPPSELTTAEWVQELPSHIVNGELVVPPGTVFAMGDNRTESADGRFWGFVPDENIVGRPMFVYWSFDTPEDQESKTSISDRLSFMGHVILHIFDGTRWKRTFHVVR